MKLVFIFLAACAASVIAADDAPSKCVTPESEHVFTVKDVIPSDPHTLDRYPVVKVDEAGKPVGLEWRAKVSCEAASQKVAVVDGKEIHRFIFWEKDKNKDGDGIVSVWFGIQTAAPSGGMGFRPFLVFGGDEQVRWWESFCEHDKSDGFTLAMEYTLKGTGVYWTRSIVGFKKGEPVPLRIESGGRGQCEPDIKAYR